jgi:hypothetical protein
MASGTYFVYVSRHTFSDYNLRTFSPTSSFGIDVCKGYLDPNHAPVYLTTLKSRILKKSKWKSFTNAKSATKNSLKKEY